MKSKLWNFSIHDYQELVSKVAPLAPHVVLGPLPPYVLKVCVITFSYDKLRPVMLHKVVLVPS